MGLSALPFAFSSDCLEKFECFRRIAVDAERFNVGTGDEASGLQKSLSRIGDEIPGLAAGNELAVGKVAAIKKSFAYHFVTSFRCKLCQGAAGESENFGNGKDL